VRKAAWGRALLVAATLAVLPMPELADAQSPGGLRIAVASRIVADGESPAPLRISVGPHDAIPPRSFLNLRGLPPSVGLTEGHSIGPGAWAVPLNALPTLKAYIPAGVLGESEITISLIGQDGRLLAVARTALVVRPPAARQREPSRSPSAAERPDRVGAERLLARGEASLANGNVEIARQFLLRAAEAGLAAAALRLGATYDPAELGRLQAQGVVPDPALARKWYERARELGAPEANERLVRLGGG
jgi:hypothetical protein